MNHKPAEEVTPKSMQSMHHRLNVDKIVEYYENTSLDYGTWSSDYNMHFGYWRRGLNPFRREPMLQEMNKQVISRLSSGNAEERIYDLGCGLGATMRTFAQQYPHRRISGITLVEWQIKKAQEINEAAGLGYRISIIHGNYLDIPASDNTITGAYALESCCHSPGENKAAFLKELNRILKSDARCLIVDGFTKVARNDFTRIFRFCVDNTCKGWALPCFPALDPFLDKMKELGFIEIEARDISWQIAPSALHSPFCVAGFIIKKWWQGERLNKVRLGHLKSCLLGLVLGMCRRQFGYFIITARKQTVPTVSL